MIYHNGFYLDGVGHYEQGSFPWLDLLVRLGKTWYGPEREPDDGINALPLPAGYRWEATGGFEVLSNGEGWWNKSSTEGGARLIGPTGKVMLELPLRVMFHGSGGSPPLPPATSTPVPPPPPT